MTLRRKKIRGKYKRMKRIVELSEEIFKEQFDPETPSADIGDVIELLCLVVDQLQELEEFRRLGEV